MWTKISTSELYHKLEESPGRVHLIDVREKEYYEREHIKGAISIPLTELNMRVSQCYNHGDEIILYCTDSECKLSPKGAKILDKKGFNKVLDYEGGLKEWKESGMPVEGIVRTGKRAA